MDANVLFMSSQLVHLEINLVIGESFLCSFVYGDSSATIRTDLFQQLLSFDIDGPWVVMGDFNCLTGLDECTGHAVRLQEIIPLYSCIDSCGLHDLRFNGCFFTWSNKRSGEARVFSKNDRVLGNQAWEDGFPTTEVTFLLEGSLDHTPLLVQFIEQPRRKKPFKFFNHWAE